jgi:hypothetical protein
VKANRLDWVFSRVTVRVVGVFVRRSGAGARRWEWRRAMGWSGGWRGVDGMAAWRGENLEKLKK